MDKVFTNVQELNILFNSYKKSIDLYNIYSLDQLYFIKSLMAIKHKVISIYEYERKMITDGQSVYSDGIFSAYLDVLSLAESYKKYCTRFSMNKSDEKYIDSLILDIKNSICFYDKSLKTIS